MLSMGMAGCDGISAVQEVHRNPDRNWFNSTVQLKGTVVDQAPLIEAQVYQLQDETGKIWILTTDPSLQVGEKVLVKGKVEFQSIPIAGQDHGEAYIEEQQRERMLDNDQ